MAQLFVVSCRRFFDHTGHINISHTTWRYLTQSIPNLLRAPQCFIDLRWCFSFIMTMFVWIQIISLNCFVITLVALISNPAMHVGHVCGVRQEKSVLYSEKIKEYIHRIDKWLMTLPQIHYNLAKPALHRLID